MEFPHNLAHIFFGAEVAAVGHCGLAFQALHFRDAEVDATQNHEVLELLELPHALAQSGDAARMATAHDFRSEVLQLLEFPHALVDH